MYYSHGWGGGKWNDSFNYGPGIFDFKTTTGQIDWQGIYDYNKQSDARYQLESGELAEGFSKVVQTEYLASHHWAGWMGSLEKRTNFGSFSIGSHYRYFSSTIKQKLTDLLGGPYYIDDYSWSLAGVDGRNEIRNPGDIIRANNGAIMHQLTFFGQSEGRYKRFHYYFGANITGNSYQRTDVYNYPDHEYSESVERLSYQLKAGLTAQITDKQHLFANVAWLNQSPYYKFVFGNFNNEPSYPLYNEAVQSIEGGYHLSSNPFTLKISTYRTLWQNVAFLSDEYIPLDENHETRAMVSGLNALHVGFEAESHLKVNSLLGFGAFVSLGNWRWTNDVQAKLLNSYDQVIDTVSVYAKGLYVGGQPQFQAGIFSKITICKSYTFLVETQYNDRQFASFDPQSRNEITDRTQPYRLPAYFLMNMRLKIPLKIFSINSTFSANCENLFNTHYILKGEDGVTHTLESFRGFWSFGRTFNFGLRLQL